MYTRWLVSIASTLKIVSMIVERTVVSNPELIESVSICVRVLVIVERLMVVWDVKVRVTGSSVVVVQTVLVDMTVSVDFVSNVTVCV